MNLLLYAIGAALCIGLILRFVIEPMRGSGIISIVIAEIILGLVLVSGSLGWPMLMEPYRTSVYFAYLIPVVLVMTMDGAVNILLLARLPKIQQMIGLILTALVMICSTKYN